MSEPVVIAVWVQIGTAMHRMSACVTSSDDTTSSAMENLPPMLRTVALSVEAEITSPAAPDTDD